MALIGPRPERPEFVADYEKSLPAYRARHAVLPGVTGWAQVNEGYTSTFEGTRRKLECDLFYVNHRSRSLHVVILVRTLACVLRMSGR
jgi:lipopolysaccharide/colanic/teichoic acid biosynthesis glycosyltransferase